MRIPKSWRACVTKYKKSSLLLDLFHEETETAKMNTTARLESVHDDVDRVRQWRWSGDRRRRRRLEAKTFVVILSR